MIMAFWDEIGLEDKNDVLFVFFQNSRQKIPSLRSRKSIRAKKSGLCKPEIS